MKTILAAILVISAFSSFAQDAVLRRANQLMLDTIEAHEVPRLPQATRNSKLKNKVYGSLAAHDLLRIKRHIRDVDSSPAYLPGSESRLFFKNYQNYTLLNPGDYIRIISLYQKSDLEVDIDRRGRYSAQTLGATIYEINAVKYSPALTKTGEMFTLIAVAYKDKLAPDVQRFESDFISTSTPMHSKNVKANDIMVNLTETSFGGKRFAANTAFLVRRTRSERIPWTFVYRYFFELERLNCTRDCRVTYDAGGYYGKANHFWAYRTMR
jgi:hypothetical protein